MQKRIVGIILSYVLIVIDIVVGILFVPYLLKYIGADEYGLYKLLLSTASYLSVLDFGIGGTITRYIVKYKSENARNSEENFMAMGLIIYGVLALVVILAGGGLSIAIPYLYSVSIDSNSMTRAQFLMFLLCATTAVSLFNHAYNGLINAYERFIFSRVSNIVKILLRVVLIVLGIRIKANASIIVGVDFLLALVLLICNILYSRFSIRIKIKLHNWDFKVAKEAGVFTIAILAQSIINQFNSNVDNMVLGIYTTTSIIAMYSLALQIFNMYSSLSTAISTVYLPSISSGVFRGETDREITLRTVEPSRIQLMVLLLALTGFFFIGRVFIEAWVGDGYERTYYIGCILLFASTLELSQNSITSVLKAKNKLHGKTLILAGFTGVNALLTFLLVPIIGAYGAAIGTAFSMIFGYGIALNVYYYRVIHIDLKLYFKETYRGISVATLIALFWGGLINGIYRAELLNGLNKWIQFFILAFAYSAFYVGAIVLIGLNDKERSRLKQIINHFSTARHSNRRN